MDAPKTFFVTGATGNQGGAVARHLAEAGFRVKALVRNPASAAAQNLAGRGIEIIPGDLNQPQTYKAALQHVAGVFSVQTYEHGVDKEVNQGLNLANLAKEYDIRQFIYSSVVGADLSTGIPHWESKSKIEKHIKMLQLPATILRPTSFFENFQLPAVKSRLLKGKLVAPVNLNVRQDYISTEDIGKISTQIFSQPDKYKGQTLTLSAEQLTMAQVAVIFSETLGQEIKYQKLPGIITRLVMGKKLYQMFKWINEHGGVFADDIPALNKEFGNLLSLRQWITQYFKTTRPTPNT